MATVPVSKAMHPARICRIKSGSRTVPILIALHLCRLAVKTEYVRCRVEVLIPVARSKPTCWDTSGAPRRRYRSTEFPGAYLRFCHQEVFDAVVLSEILGREVSLAKIIHGDDHGTLKVKTGLGG
jgi:hypothetical protein